MSEIVVRLGWLVGLGHGLSFSCVKFASPTSLRSTVELVDTKRADVSTYLFILVTVRYV